MWETLRKKLSSKKLKLQTFSFPEKKSKNESEHYFYFFHIETTIWIVNRPPNLNFDTPLSEWTFKISDYLPVEFRSDDV